MQPVKYEFTNWSEDTFIGRFGGVNYTFLPGETRSYDPDKHYMLILFAKQLAEVELNKSVKSVGRDPKDMETWGKSLDKNGRPFTINNEMIVSLSRKAIGSLIDVPIPVPEQDRQEAGATKEVSEDVKTLQDQVRILSEQIQALTTQKTQLRVEPVREPVKSPAAQPVTEPVTMTRDILTSMASDLGITDTDRMTKEELIHAVSSRQAQI